MRRTLSYQVWSFRTRRGVDPNRIGEHRPRSSSTPFEPMPGVLRYAQIYGDPMSELPDPETKCPYCGGEVETGCLMGKDSLLGFQWYAGDPSFLKNLFPHGESVGHYELFSGTYATGMRCLQCRKIVLDY